MVPLSVAQMSNIIQPISNKFPLECHLFQIPININKKENLKSTMQLYTNKRF